MRSTFGKSFLEVATIGESMVVFVPNIGETLDEATITTLHSAGAESNVASYLAQLGHSVGWGSRIGDDPFGRRLLREFENVGIDVSHVVIDQSRPTGVYFKDPGSQPGIFYYRSGSAASALCRQDVESLIARSSHLHITGITAALNASTAEMMRDIVKDCMGTGRTVSFDVNYRSPLWSTEEAAPVLADLGNLADTVFVGLDEAQAVWGIKRANEVPAIFGGAREVVVKDGSNGAMVFCDEGVTFEPAPRVSVVEPIGAGDAFAAGYLSGSIQEATLSVRLRWGHLLAARVLAATSDSVLLPSVEVLETQVAMSSCEWKALNF